MKTQLKVQLGTLSAAFVLALAGAVTPAQAVTIDFESTATGTYSGLSYGPVAISFLGGDGSFEVQNQSPSLPNSGHMLISYFTNPGSGSFQATFAALVNAVSIDMSDYSPSDDDEGHLRAYDAANNLLDTDFFLMSTAGPGGTLTVSSFTPIARIEWNETGSFAGAVYWDNLTYDASAAVPEPATLLLLGSGLLGLVGTRRSRNSRLGA